MSRIHEALRLAETERALGETHTTAPPPNSDIPIEPAPRERLSSLEDVTSKPLAVPAEVRDYLEFDHLRRSCTHPQWRPRHDLNIFGDDSSGRSCAEQFRSLRSRLSQIRNSQNLRSVLITSAMPDEGKTFVAANLAQSIVRQDRRVLIIDADLRSSSLHEFLGTPSAPGLTDYLRGDADEAAVIQFGEPGQKRGNLCLIPGGVRVSDPSELLSNDRLKRLLRRVAQAFDWIIIDSPPCLPVADANIIADVADGVLVVVKTGSTSGALLRKARQELRNRNVIGVVLNAVQAKPDYGPYVTSD